MKFFCHTSWVDSGRVRFIEDKAYDLSKEDVERYASMRSGNRTDDQIGAMKRFTPMDGEGKALLEKVAREFEDKSEKSKDAKPATTQAVGSKEVASPKRANLVKEAAALGVKEANKMKVDELIEAIAAKKAEAAGAQGAE